MRLKQLKLGIGSDSAMLIDKDTASNECTHEIRQADAQIPSNSSTDMSLAAHNHCASVLKGFHCKTDKPNHEFSKVQRKKGDERVCKLCVVAHMTRYRSHGGQWKSVMQNKLR